MQKITQIRIKNSNNTYSTPVPLGAEAENVVLSTGYTVEQAIGDIDVGANGNLKSQIAAINYRLTQLENIVSTTQFESYINNLLARLEALQA